MFSVDGLVTHFAGEVVHQGYNVFCSILKVNFYLNVILLKQLQKYCFSFIHGLELFCSYKNESEYGVFV